MASFLSRYMITDGVKMTEVALGLRYFHPSCFHPFLDSSSYLVWTLKCLWNVRPAFSRKKSNFQKCRPMSKSPSGMNQSRILINTVTCSIRPRKLLPVLNSHSTKKIGYVFFKFWVSYSKCIFSQWIIISR